MRSTAAFGRMEQFRREPDRDVGRVVQRLDAARPRFERRTEPADAKPLHLLTQFALLEGNKPEPGDGSDQLNLVEGNDQVAVDSHPGHVSLIVNDHERPSPDEATQGSSGESAAT